MNRNIDDIYALKGQNLSSTPYRNFNANIPHLTSWIEDILGQTEKELRYNTSHSNSSSSSFPTTDDLVIALKRYDAIFKELLHITESFIPDIVKLFSKVWANVLKLMTFMIKSYHRYVKHTENLQTETENLLTERQRTQASFNVKNEEYNLERTSLRATIRCQESELDILRNSQRLLESENTKLRTTIKEFLHSSESKESLSSFLSLESNSSIRIDDEKDSLLDYRSLNKLELIMDNIMTSVLKEHNRKNILFQDLLSFVSNFLEKKKRNSIIYPSTAISSPTATNSSNSSSNTASTFVLPSPTPTPTSSTISLPKVIEFDSANRLYTTSKIITTNNGKKDQLVFKPSTYASSPITTEKQVEKEYIIKNFFSYEMNRKNLVSVGIQVDSKEEHGLVLSIQNLKNISYSSVLLSNTLNKKNLSVNTSSILKSSGSVSIEEVSELGIAPLPPQRFIEEGSDFPYSIRKYMNTFPRIYRIPTIHWTNQTILLIYLDKLERLEDEFHTYIPLNSESCKLMDSNSLRYSTKSKKKNNLLRNNNNTSFTNKTNHNINSNIKIYEDDTTSEIFNKYNPILPLTLNSIHSNDELSIHLVNYFLRVTGLQSVADVQLVRLMKACEAHHTESLRVQLFSSQLGLMNKEKKPTFDSRDTIFILQVLKCLRLQGELKSDYDDIAIHKSIKKQVQNPILEPIIRPEITRVAAIHTIKKIFSNWLPDEGDEYCVKVKAMICHSDQGARYVDLDEYLNMLIEPWQVVRKQWEDHAKHLFQLYSYSYRVIGEACFSNDAGQICSDTVCVLVEKDTVEDCQRRPLRIFMKEEEEENENEKNNKKVIDNSKEPVVDLMSKSKFIQCIQLILPDLEMSLIEAMYEEALEYSHQLVVRKLSQMWKSYIDSNSNILVSLNNNLSRKKFDDDTEYDHEDNFSASVTLMNAASEGKTGAGNSKLGTNREFWVNLDTAISQWVRPYYENTFRSQDIELDAFVYIVIRFDLMARSPLLEFIHMSPKDLWINADIFHKQIIERKNKK